jgi:hypothetical protein
MTVTSPGPSSDRTLGQVLHEAWMAAGMRRHRPWPPEEWPDRIPELKAVDEAMAAAVAAAALAEVRQVVADFSSHHAGVLNPQAEALYHAVLQVIDRKPLERGEGEAPAQPEQALPVAAEVAPPEIKGQLPFPGVETAP